MEHIKELFENYVLISAALAWLMAQILKMIIELPREKNLRVFKRFFSNGGMPSSHSSAVCAMTASSAVCFGFGSFEFAVSFILSAIVMVDALGVRYETGEQAKIINRIVKEIFSGDAKEVNTGLKELVGHTPFQVLIGAILGLSVGIALPLILL